LYLLGPWIQIYKDGKWFQVNGRQFNKGDSSTPIPHTPNYGQDVEPSVYNCARTCMNDNICFQFVYNPKSHECSRYKHVSNYQETRPLGNNDELVYSDEAEVNYCYFISHCDNNLTFNRGY
jgi:hypothetical protein